MNACEDFFTIIVEAHILAAAMAAFGMSSVDDKPNGVLFTENCCDLDKKYRHVILQREVSNLIDR